MKQVSDWLPLLAGITILLVIGQRRFKRRGIGGLQHFPNYWMALFTLFLEWLFKWLGALLILLGLLIALFT